MRKFRILVLCLLVYLFSPLVVNAASAKISVTGPSQAVVGNTITVKVTLSSSVNLGSWEMDLDYNKSYLSMTSSSAEAGGTVMSASTATSLKSKSYTFKFKVLKTGSTTISVPSYDVYAMSDTTSSSLSISSSSKTIKLITQEQLEASYSKNNDLKSLSVEGYEITPAFAKDTLDYSVTVPEGTKQINIQASASDSRSKVSGTGAVDVTEGNNSFEIVVRAENGSEKTYTLKVDVKDENPINVKVDNTSYTVVKLRENLPKAPMYEEYTLKINNYDIPAYRNKSTKLVLVGLKNPTGVIALFIYDESTKEYRPYYEIGQNKITIYPLTPTSDVKGYEKGEITINNYKAQAYYVTKDSRFALIYGVNIETGEEGFYEYDKENQTLAKYNDEFIKTLEAKTNLYTYIIVGFIGIFVVMFIIMISLAKRSKKRKNKNKQDIHEFKVVKQNKETAKIKEEMKNKKK